MKTKTTRLFFAAAAAVASVHCAPPIARSASVVRSSHQGVTAPQGDNAMSPSPVTPDKSQATSALQAFRVRHKSIGAGAPLGYLGEGEGPFISRMRSRLAHPWAEAARYTSLELTSENDVGPVLEKSKSFSDVKISLQEKGYILEPVTYTDVFAPADDAPRTAPGVSDPARVKGL
jgi:hypothetical protein